jgi:hypothetical protein
MLGINPRAIKMSKISGEIQAAGGPTTPTQYARLIRLDRERSNLSLADFILVAVSLGLMATARFWVF